MKTIEVVAAIIRKSDAILALEKNTPAGDIDYREVREEILNAIQEGSIDDPVELKP